MLLLVIVSPGGAVDLSEGARRRRLELCVKRRRVGGEGGGNGGEESIFGLEKSWRKIWQNIRHLFFFLLSSAAAFYDDNNKILGFFLFEFVLWKRVRKWGFLLLRI